MLASQDVVQKTFPVRSSFWLHCLSLFVHVMYPSTVQVNLRRGERLDCEARNE